MLKKLAYVGLISAAIAASPGLVYAAEQTPPDKMAPSASAPDANAPAQPANDQPQKMTPPAAAPSAAADQPKTEAPKTDAAKADMGKPDTFVTQQADNQWRASKLVGVSVYGPDQKKVGSIKDVLVDHDGNAQVIVVGVGGFLGMGAKDVGVPFKAMQWRTEGRAAATNPPPASTSGSGNGMAPSAAPSTPANPAQIEASQGYPDMGVLNMTEAQLKSAPDFHYASSAAEASSSPAPAASGGGATKP
jgi:sporulation protein YlmC with PRC-barrel domain